VTHSDVAFIIPSRLGSTRLPKKALADIGGKTMIEHVVSRLTRVSDTNLYVATDSADIAQKVKDAGGIAIMTSESCPTGSDRAFEAFKNIPLNDKIKYIINVQGDMPFVDYKVVEQIVEKLKASDFDIVTPVVEVGLDIASSDSNVKAVADKNGKAMYFSRSLIPHGAKKFLYHVGIYGYKVDALEKFVKLNETQYESVEKLEQLRALENGMSVGVVVSNEIPISVDTFADLEKAREFYAKSEAQKKL
jgi:3-deoxy-manno-octulosonate cytidylyltransferase (CMP-KDO synthetase)